MRIGSWCILALCLASAAVSADVPVLGFKPILQGGDDHGPQRSAFVRGENVRLVIPVTVKGGEPTRIHGQARLAERDGSALWRQNWKLPDQSGPSAVSRVELSLPCASWRTGAYTVEVEAWSGPLSVQTNLSLWICPEPDRPGFVLGMLHEQVRRGAALAEQLDELKASGFSAAMHYQPTPELMEAGLRQGVNALAILHGGGFKGARESMLRMNAGGMPFDHDPLKPGSGRWGISHPEWRAAVAGQIEAQARRWSAFPGFLPVIHTSDDYFRWTGMDYNTNNATAFRARHGIDPPRPPEALETDYPMLVDCPPGIVADGNPWVLWQRFNALDVLGGLNGMLAGAVRRGTEGRGLIGPVCGGGPWALGTIPLVDLPSGQWPPYNFGSGHFSLVSYYNYNCYWFPALAQVWWAELARMGNRTMPVWVMPDTMDLRRTYHLQNVWLFLAGGVDGINYFLYEWSSPGSREALRRIGPELARVKDLLGGLEPAPRTLGLLMPFETACFRASHPADASYAFANLVMAGAEIEPVWPEELPERGRNYRAVLLYDVDWLTEGNVSRLQEYQQRGGRVIADAGSAVDWPGVERLDFDLAHPRRAGGYGDLRLIERIRAALAGVAESWAQTGDPHLLLRRFRLDDVDYLWVVHLMNQDEDRAHIHDEPGREFKVEPLAEYADFDQVRYAARFSVPAGSFRHVADMIGRHPPAEVIETGGRSEISLSVAGWQGRLLAFYPSRPDEVRLALPASARLGGVVAGRIEIRSEGRPVTMSMPLALDVIQPDGARNAEYSRTLAVRRGRAGFRLDLALNDMKGEWTIRASEISTGISAEARLTVEPSRRTSPRY